MLSKFKNALTLVRRSMQSEHHDFTTGPIPDAVILLAIPMILELSLESIFAVVDMFFVSKLGQNAIATVGLTESVVTIIYSVAIGVSTAATAVVARRVGEKNPEAAAHAGAQSILIALVLSVVLSIIGAFYASDILALMGAAPEVIQEGSSFARIMLGATGPIIFLFLINGIFRGAGDAAMAMKSLWLASGMNIILCPILIHFLGLKGAAIATVIGRSSGVAYQVFHMIKGDGELKFRMAHFKIDFPIIKSLLSIAWPASFQFIIGSGSWILLTRLVAETGGTAASAGYQIAFRNFVFFILPAWGLSNAAATLMGQNLGAKRFDRAEQAVLTTSRYSVFLMTIVTLIFLFFSGPLVGTFTQDPAVLEHGTRALQVLGSGFIFYGLSMVMTQALNGAGDTKTPTWLNFVCHWLFQVPLAFFLAKTMQLQSKGVILAIPAAQALLALLAYYIFKRGRWKLTKV